MDELADRVPGRRGHEGAGEVSLDRSGRATRSQEPQLRAQRARIGGDLRIRDRRVADRIGQRLGTEWPDALRSGGVAEEQVQVVRMGDRDAQIGAPHVGAMVGVVRGGRVEVLIADQLAAQGEVFELGNVPRWELLRGGVGRCRVRGDLIAAGIVVARASDHRERQRAETIEPRHAP